MNAGTWLNKVREQRPLVHNITNVVVTNIAANALLSIGASPVMAYAHEEVGEMATIASALALNMGTLDADVVEAMWIAGRAANAAGVPIVFDPVGVGATAYRTQVARGVAQDMHLAVLRGNAGEMSVLLGAGGSVKGVDAGEASSTLAKAMVDHAKAQKRVLVATGETDIVTDGEHLWTLHNGHPLLASITGSGCMLTAILGAFLGAAGRNAGIDAYAEACVAALTCYNVAAELAADVAQGPGTFQAALFDALYRLDGDTVAARARIDVMEAK